MVNFQDFFAFFNTKGDNIFDILFAFLGSERLPKRVYFDRKEFAPEGANSFLSVLIPIENGSKSKIYSFASPDNVPIHLKAYVTLKGLNQSDM